MQIYLVFAGIDILFLNISFVKEMMEGIETEKS